jgi:hypothetical protein
MREYELLSERIQISTDYVKLFNFTMNFLKEKNYKVDDLSSYDEYQQTFFHILNTTFSVLQHFIEQRHKLQTEVNYDMGKYLEDNEMGIFDPYSNTIIIHVGPLLYYADLYYEGHSHHKSFFSGFSKYLKMILKAFFHELTHAIQLQRMANKNIPNYAKYQKGIENLNKSKLKQVPDSPTEEYYTKHAEIEAFVKTFLHDIILKDYKKFKNLSGPALSNKIREIVVKYVPMYYRKYRGTKSDHIYKTIVKKLYLDIMDYIEDMRKTT